MLKISGTEHFPTVGVFGNAPLIRMLLAPALALGVDIVSLQTDIGSNSLGQCSVVTVIGDSIPVSQVKTFENADLIFRSNSSVMSFVKEWNQNRDVEDFDAKLSILVARSPHGQASAWTPTQIVDRHSLFMTVTPPPVLSLYQLGIAQTLALDLARNSAAVGVMDVEIVLKDGEFLASHLSLGPTPNGLWTIEGARTSQFEQHLRAILDLPLGDPSLTAPFAVSSSFFGEGNMYRPYLHLMARSPGLKFHQYGSDAVSAKGHVTALGWNLLDLQECVSHAIDYMSGVIDE